MTGAESEETARAGFIRRLSTRNGILGLTVGPGLLWLVALLLAPLTFMVAVSFVKVDQLTYQIVWEPTLGNYRELLLGGDVVLWQTEYFVITVTPFLNSLLLSYFIATVTTILCLVLAFPLAYLLATRSDRTFSVIIFLVLLPFFTMYLVRAYSWVLMFGSGGVINNLLISLGIVGEPVGLFNYGVFAIIVGLTHAYFPYMLLTLYASMDGLDLTLIEAARDLGATRRDTVRDLVIPLTLPGIIGGSLFVFVPSVGAFITPRFLGQGKVQMVGQLIKNAIGYGYAVDYAGAASMFIVVTIVVAFILSFRYVTIEDLGGV